MPENNPSLYSRIESEINNYISSTTELSPGVNFSQNKLIERIYKFQNHDQSVNKINEDLSYNYWFDIITPRVDSEVKNLRFDTKNILVFSQNPRLDFGAVFIANASLKNWFAQNGEDLKLKTAVERFTANGNIGFKRIRGGYEIMDDLNTYITNPKAETVNDTDIIERHEMTASQMRRMTDWDQDNLVYVIKELGNKSFTASQNSTPISTTSNRYEIFEFTGQVSEREYNDITKSGEVGDESKFFIAKLVLAGLSKSKDGDKYCLFHERLDNKKMSDYYVYAHRGRYQGRFWRVGMTELLFDHQLRANQIANDLAAGLGWASKVIFKSADGKIMGNMKADMENGDIVNTQDLSQVTVRMQGADQLIADWNRLMNDANTLSNSYEVTRGETPTSGTPLGTTQLMDINAGKMFTLLRQKISLPYKQVFREWVLPELVKGLQAKDIFRFTGETEILDELRKIIVESWYQANLVKIGPHNQQTADAIKEAKMEEIKKKDPALKNSPEVWKDVSKRLFVTITGENYDIPEMLQDLFQLVQLESDPDRVAFILDTIYKSRGIPIPPKKEQPQPMMLDQQNPQSGQSPEQNISYAQKKQQATNARSGQPTT